MATSNFYNENASRIFASEVQEDYKYDDLKSNIEYELKSLEESFSSSQTNIDYEILDYSLRKSFYYKDGTSIEAIIRPIIRSGYYSGVNLDWIYELKFDSSEIETEDDIKDDLIYYSDYKEGKARKVSIARFKKLNKYKDYLVEKLEKIYSDYTTPLKVSARFSNGETLYEKA